MEYTGKSHMGDKPGTSHLARIIHEPGMGPRWRSVASDHPKSGDISAINGDPIHLFHHSLTDGPTIITCRNYGLEIQALSTRAYSMASK